MAQEASALGGRSVTSSNGDCRFVVCVAETLGSLRDADKRGAEVALDVYGESFDRGDIKDAAAGFFGRLVDRKHQAVDAPEECGERLAGAGRGENQC